MDRCVAVAPPLPLPMFGQMRTVEFAVPVQEILRIDVVSTFAPESTFTVPKFTAEMLTEQDCAAAGPATRTSNMIHTART
jgi:hypothetical protein